MTSSNSARVVQRRVALASLGALAAMASVSQLGCASPVSSQAAPLSFEELLDEVLPLAEHAATQGAAGEPAYLRQLATLAARTGWEPSRPLSATTRNEVILERQPVVFMLFHLERGAAIPAHDHHGYCALLKVLSGHPVIHEYRPVHPTRSRSAESFAVTRSARRVLAPGRLAAASSRHAPIHRIESPDDATQLVDIFTLHSTPASRLVHLDGDPEAERRMAHWGALM